MAWCQWWPRSTPFGVPRPQWANFKKRLQSYNYARLHIRDDYNCITSLHPSQYAITVSRLSERHTFQYIHLVSATSPSGASSVSPPHSSASSLVSDIITAWKSAVNLTYLNDDDPFTCETFSTGDPVLLLAPFQPFSSVMVRVYTENLRAESQDCSTPLLMATHNTQLSLGEDPCLPFCGNPIRCLLESDPNEDYPGYYTFMCPCNEASCRGIILAIQPSAVIDNTKGFRVCQVQKI